MTEEAAAVLDLTVEAYVRAFVAANESAVSYGASTQLPIDRQRDDEVKAIIGSRFVTAQCAAAGAFMRDYIALLRVRLGKDRLERCAAFGCAVARILVDMQRPETVRAVIA